MEAVGNKNWWALALNGIIAILFGILAIFVPSSTILVLGKYFGFVVLLGGLILLFVTVRNAKAQKPYMGPLIEGLVSIALGVLIVIHTQKTLEVFVIIIGIWGLLIGGFQLFVVMSIKGPFPGKKLFVFNGALAVLFGILLFFNPFAAAEFFVVIIGLMAVMLGILLLHFAFRLKGQLSN
jgi:uncharacterized membrane protein HdeD (DUF308 family)